MLNQIRCRKIYTEYLEIWLRHYKEQNDEYLESYRILHYDSVEGLMLKIETKQKSRFEQVRFFNLEFLKKNFKASKEQVYLFKETEKVMIQQCYVFHELQFKRLNEKAEYSYYVKYLDEYVKLIPEVDFICQVKDQVDTLAREIKILKDNYLEIISLL